MEFKLVVFSNQGGIWTPTNLQINILGLLDWLRLQAFVGFCSLILSFM